MRFFGQRHILLFFFICSLSFSVIAQNNPEELDSLFQVLRTSDDPKVKATVHSRIAWLNIINDIELAKAHLDTSMQLYSQTNNERGVANVKYRYAVLHRFAGEYDTALTYAREYLDYVNSINDSLALANIYYQLGVIYGQGGDYESSLNEYYNCLRIYEALDDPSSRAFTLNSIGIIYKNLNKYEDAEEAYLEAVSLLEPIEDKSNLADVYNSLGNLYAILNETDKALDYFNRSLDIGIELKKVWGIAEDYSSIGMIYLDLGNTEKALNFLLKAEDIYRENNYEEDHTESLLNIAIVYAAKEDFKNSENYLISALERKPESMKLMKNIHFELYKLYSASNQIQKALFHHENYSSYKDSIYKTENIESINKLQLQYQTEKKDLQLAQNEILIEQAEVDYLKKKNQLYLAIGVGGLLLLLATALWLFFRQRQLVKNQEIENLKTQRELTKLESLIEGEEKERKRLAQDLHDGINGELSVIKYKIDTVGQEKLNPKEKSEIDEAVHLLDKAIQQVRNISHNLAPPSLLNFNLNEAIKQNCHNLSASSDIKIDYQSFGSPVKLNLEYETAIYRMIQELLNNVVRHSESTEALVQINHHEDSLDITVEDNGKGYDTSVHHAGIGLKNIHSRASFLNTKCVMESGEMGTSANFHINIDQLNNDKSSNS
jgi:signal transduction histidine kinase